MDFFNKPISCIKGVGPKITAMMNKMNIFTIEDVLNHYPRAYEDRTNVKPVCELSDGEIVSIIGEAALIDKDRYTKNGKHVTRIVFKSDGGFVVGIWYNQKFIRKNFKIGERYTLYGKVSKIIGETQIIGPEYEKVEGSNVLNNIMPVYPATKNLSQKILRNIIYKVLNSQEFKVEDTLKEGIRNQFELCTMDFAIRNIHFPSDYKSRMQAEKRLKFEELLMLQLGLMLEKSDVEKSSDGISFKIDKELNDFVSSLPFKLTNAQKRAVNEILKDMKSNKPMNRLVQGDVGSGKTIVGVLALFNAVKNGYQGALMAPTEILAEQHYNSITDLMKDYNIRVELLSGKLTKKQKDEMKERLKEGQIDIIVGTHAVIQNDVEFSNLGLVITDEQHRFGVRQRAMLANKGKSPDVLVMTATPIPRTMALFLYGDLDISIIDEMPPGRQKVDTYGVKPSMRERIYNFVRKQIKSGRQAYVVCPLVEESDAIKAESVVKTYESLKNEYLRDVRIGLIHGKMKPNEKDEIMSDFKNQKIDVLVSTTVIEVGIDVPNATIIVIEDADRFGLAQLHQLRGRVGRGKHKSYCILISQMKSNTSKQRIKVMQETSDGFKISERDMELRGTGEFFGTRQHGLPELKLANIVDDIEILKMANILAKELVESEKINSHEFSLLKEKIEKKFKAVIDEIALN